MNPTETIQTIDAAALFRAAYENRYTWDRAFPGFRAVAHLVQGDQACQAHIQVSSDLKITITDASSEEAIAAIYDQVQEIVIHRVRRNFEAVHGRNEFTNGGTDASGAVVILVGGAAAGDRYKVHNNIVSMVHRRIHGTVVTINVFATLDTGKGYLPTDYESAYSKPNTNELDGPKQQHHDDYVRIGDYFILMSRRISQGDNAVAVPVQEFRLTDIVLLEH